MKTLYDQLGVRPEDDQENFKKAFRDAIKASHPDIHPGDPDAALRFRQTVRAHAILSDPELRADYDRMLAYEQRLSAASAERGFVSDAMAKVLSDAVAIGVLVVVLLGGYALFVHVSKPSDAAVGAAPARAPVAAAVAVMTTPQPTAARDAPRDAPARAEVPHEAGAPGAVTPAATTGGGETIAAVTPAATATKDDAPPDMGKAPDPAPRDAKYYREQGIIAYRADDFDRAIANFDLAIGLDPNFEGAYVDRGTAFYRIGDFDRAFADIAQAKRIANSNRSGTPSLSAQRKSPPSRE